MNQKKKKLLTFVLCFGLFVYSHALADSLIMQHMLLRSGISAGNEYFYPAVYAGTSFPADKVECTLPNGLKVSLWDADKVRGALDKIVFVENTSEHAVYFRTVVAIPAPAGFDTSKALINYSDDGYTVSQPDFRVSITHGGYTQQYRLIIFTSETQLPTNTKSLPSLLQIALDKTLTNKDMEALGGRFDLLVKSEAFALDAGETIDSIMYPITAVNHPWNR